MTQAYTIQALTQEAHERAIDDFLAEGKPFKDIPLILPAHGNPSRYTYRGFTVRRWQDPQTGIERYDSAFEYL